MSILGIVLQPGKGPGSSFTPGRSITIKLPRDATGDSIMLFEETVPPGTKSTLHSHHDSDEVLYVLAGGITFLIGEDVTVGGPELAPSCHEACHTPGRTPEQKTDDSWPSTPRPRLAA